MYSRVHLLFHLTVVCIALACVFLSASLKQERMGRILPNGLRLFSRPSVHPSIRVCVCFVPRFVVYRAVERYYVYTVGAFCFWPSVSVRLSQKPQALELLMLTGHCIWKFLHK